MNIVHTVISLFKSALIGLALAAALFLAATLLSQSGDYAASIVKVTSAANQATGGTGFVTDSLTGKVIVTNARVCAVAQNGFARIEDDAGTPYIKRVLRQSFERDLCILEGIDAPSLPLAKRGPKRFETLTVYGHPGLRPTAPATGSYTGPGIVPIGFNANKNGECPSSTETVDSLFGTFCVLRMELGYTTVPIMPGNSGSPVTNSNGEVIGVMNSADSTGNQGMFIPLNYLKDILAE